MNDKIESMKFTYQFTTLMGLFDVKQVINTLVCDAEKMGLAFAILFQSFIYPCYRRPLPSVSGRGETL